MTFQIMLFTMVTSFHHTITADHCLYNTVKLVNQSYYYLYDHKKQPRLNFNGAKKWCEDTAIGDLTTQTTDYVGDLALEYTTHAYLSVFQGLNCRFNGTTYIFVNTKTRNISGLNFTQTENTENDDGSCMQLTILRDSAWTSGCAGSEKHWALCKWTKVMPTALSFSTHSSSAEIATYIPRTTVFPLAKQYGESVQATITSPRSVKVGEPSTNVTAATRLELKAEVEQDGRSSNTGASLIVIAGVVLLIVALGTVGVLYRKHKHRHQREIASTAVSPQEDEYDTRFPQSEDASLIDYDFKMPEPLSEPISFTNEHKRFAYMSAGFVDYAKRHGVATQLSKHNVSKLTAIKLQ